MNQTKSNICILIVSFALLFVAGCGSRFSMEQEEAQNVVDSIRKLDCLQEYTQYETGIINDENIYICFWGDCNLQDVFETTQCVNEYFQAHAESIILTE